MASKMRQRPGYSVVEGRVGESVIAPSILSNDLKSIEIPNGNEFCRLGLDTSNLLEEFGAPNPSIDELELDSSLNFLLSHRCGVNASDRLEELGTTNLSIDEFEFESGLFGFQSAATTADFLLFDDANLYVDKATDFGSYQTQFLPESNGATSTKRKTATEGGSFRDLKFGKCTNFNSEETREKGTELDGSLMKDREEHIGRKGRLNAVMLENCPQVAVEEVSDVISLEASSSLNTDQDETPLGITLSLQECKGVSQRSESSPSLKIETKAFLRKGSRFPVSVIPKTAKKKRGQKNSRNDAFESGSSSKKVPVSEEGKERESCSRNLSDPHLEKNCLDNEEMLDKLIPEENKKEDEENGCTPQWLEVVDSKEDLETISKHERIKRNMLTNGDDCMEHNKRNMFPLHSVTHNSNATDYWNQENPNVDYAKNTLGNLSVYKNPLWSEEFDVPLNHERGYSSPASSSSGRNHLHSTLPLEPTNNLRACMLSNDMEYRKRLEASSPFFNDNKDIESLDLVSQMLSETQTLSSEEECSDFSCSSSESDFSWTNEIPQDENHLIPDESQIIDERGSSDPPTSRNMQVIHTSSYESSCKMSPTHMDSKAIENPWNSLTVRDGKLNNTCTYLKPQIRSSWTMHQESDNDIINTLRSSYNENRKRYSQLVTIEGIEHQKHENFMFKGSSNENKDEDLDQSPLQIGYFPQLEMLTDYEGEQSNLEYADQINTSNKQTIVSNKASIQYKRASHQGNLDDMETAIEVQELSRPILKEQIDHSNGDTSMSDFRERKQNKLRDLHQSGVIKMPISQCETEEPEMEESHQGETKNVPEIHFWHSMTTEQSGHNLISEVKSPKILEYDHFSTNAMVRKTLLNNQQPEKQINLYKESNKRSTFSTSSKSDRQATTYLQNESREENKKSSIQDHDDTNIQHSDDFDNVPVSSLVHSFFGSQMKAQGVSKIKNSSPIMKIEHEPEVLKIEANIEALEIELSKFRKENKKLEKLIKENEKKASKLSREKEEWEHQKRDQIEGYNMFQEERQHLKKERSMLQKQMKLLLQLPCRKERNEINDLKEKIAKITAEQLKKESRWNLTTKRLRRAIEELTRQNTELHEEIRRYERLLQAERDANGKLRNIDGHQSGPSSRDNLKDSFSSTNFKRENGCLELSKEDSKNFKIENEAGNPNNLCTVELDYFNDDQVSFLEKFEGRKKENNISEHDINGNDVCKPINKSEKDLYAASTERMDIVAANSTLQMDFYKGEESKCEKEYTTSAYQGPIVMDSQEFLLTEDSVSHQEFGFEEFTDTEEKELRSPSSKGKKSFLFPDGTKMEVYKDGLTRTYFRNGDIKNIQKDGTVECYYSEIDTWHITKANGVEFFYIPKQSATIGRFACKRCRNN